MTEEQELLKNYYKDLFECQNFDQLKKCREELLDNYNDRTFIDFFSKEFLDTSLVIIDEFLLRKEMNILNKILNQKG